MRRIHLWRGFPNDFHAGMLPPPFVKELASWFLRCTFKCRIEAGYREYGNFSLSLPRDERRTDRAGQAVGRGSTCNEILLPVSFAAIGARQL